MNREDQLLNRWMQATQILCSSCQQAGRLPAEVRLMAVTKYAPDEDVLFLLNRGVLTDIGESRVQTAQARWQENPLFARQAVTKHFIGHLQKNKAAKAAEIFDFIDSIDSKELALLLDQKAGSLQKPLRGLIQVKLTHRQEQAGLDLISARALAKELKDLQYLKICGYMAIAPQTDNPQTLRPLFGQLKEAFEQDFPLGEERHLSLGMSNDFKEAVSEGSTLVRLGSFIFARDSEEA